MQPTIISSRLIGGFATLLVLLVITFVASERGVSRLTDLNAAVAQARDILAEVAAVRGSLRDVESARRAYVLTHDAQLLALYLATTKDAAARLGRLRDLTADDPAQRRRVDAIAPLTARQLTVVTDSVASAPKRSRDAARPAPDDGTIVGEQVRALIVELEDGARARLREREADANRHTVAVIRGFGAVALVSLLLLGAAYYLLDRAR